MFPTTTLTPLSAEVHAALLAEYNHAADPESRTRYQMILLAVERDLSPRQIAPLVHRSHDTVLRVLQRYHVGGLAAVPRKKGPGPKPKITAAWEEELLRVVEDDPHDYGSNAANWTTQLLADYLAQKTGIAVDPETVRRALHRHELLSRPLRRAVTHNHHRDDVVDLFRDAYRHFAGLDAHPERALRHIGSPFADGSA
jgi:transposase